MTVRRVVEIEATDTYPLRRRVLRTGTISTEVAFAGDDEGFHLGVVEAVDGDTGGDSQLVAIASWLAVDAPERPGRPAYQLRGMATDPSRRGTGTGRLLLDAGLTRAAALGAEVVVANARVSALGFYLTCGWQTVGDEYLDTTTTGLPHQRIMLDLADARTTGSRSG